MKWIRRRPDIPEGSEPFGYAEQIAALMWAFIIASAVELVVVHLLLANWPTIRLIAVVVSIWGLVYTAGATASVMVHPHLVDGRGLLIRYAESTIRVPWSMVASISTSRKSHEGIRVFQLVDARLDVVVGGQTTLEVALTEPMVVPVRHRDHTVERIRFHADQPAALARRVRAEVD